MTVRQYDLRYEVSTGVRIANLDNRNPSLRVKAVYSYKIQNLFLNLTKVL